MHRSLLPLSSPMFQQKKIVSSLVYIFSTPHPAIQPPVLNTQSTMNPHPAAPYPVNLHRSCISQEKGKNIRNLTHKISENTIKSHSMIFLTNQLFYTNDIYIYINGIILFGIYHWYNFIWYKMLKCYTRYYLFHDYQHFNILYQNSIIFFEPNGSKWDTHTNFTWDVFDRLFLST